MYKSDIKKYYMATSINELPNELNIEKNEDNISMVISEKNKIVPSMNIREDVSVENTTSNNVSKQNMNDILSGLKKASESGSTMLQSRDIPMSTQQINEDYSARPNFVPSPSQDKTNYIQDEETMETLIRQKKQLRKTQMDNFYDEIQTPLLIMVMFFVFQLPIFKKSMINNFPAFFKQSGSYNLKGLVFTTMLFGGSYYGIIKSIKYLSEI